MGCDALFYKQDSWQSRLRHGILQKLRKLHLALRMNSSEVEEQDTIVLLKISRLQSGMHALRIDIVYLVCDRFCRGRGLRRC